jgi:hypothetical protein
VALENRKKLTWRTGSDLFSGKDAAAYIIASRQKLLNIYKKIKEPFYGNDFRS